MSSEALRLDGPGRLPADRSRGSSVQARRAGFARDVWSVAIRALKALPREPEMMIPSLIIPIFFFAVNIGQLQDFAQNGIPGLDFRAFQLPSAIIFAVTGVSRAMALVTDIQSGYFDRLLMTPMRRLALLLGLMVADFALVLMLILPVVALGLAVGVRFETGILGAILFVLMGGLWGLVFTGFPYAIALKTGSPAATGTSFILFFPFAFLTTATVPLEVLTGWMQSIARFNPVTYVLAALRSLLYGGWQPEVLLQGFLAIALIGVISMSLALAALRGRVTRG
ncbi:MAG: ABC transporter permease [Chloroflexota bacterium]|nr:ABC transporter permease [Chloroflexota bacterium]